MVITQAQWRMLHALDSFFAASEIYPSARELSDLIYGASARRGLAAARLTLRRLMKRGLVKRHGARYELVHRYELTLEGADLLRERLLELQQERR